MWFGSELFFNQPMRFYEMRHVTKTNSKKVKQNLFIEGKNLYCVIGQRIADDLCG